MSVLSIYRVDATLVERSYLIGNGLLYPLLNLLYRLTWLVGRSTAARPP